MSSSPCHLAGGGRSALARIVNDSSLTLGLPVLVREHRPRHADEIAEVEVVEDVELLVAQSMLLRIDLDAAGLWSRTSMNMDLPMSRWAVMRPATETLVVSAAHPCRTWRARRRTSRQA